MQLLTAILGAAQGLRGELKADIRTDNPTKRFKKGTVVKTDSEFFPTLTVRGYRINNSKSFLSFEEITDRTVAEKMCFTKIFVDTDEIEDEDEEEGYYLHELQGLAVYDVERNLLGKVVDLIFGSMQDIIVVEPEPPMSLTDSDIENVSKKYEDVLVPFARQIVLEVNLDEGYILLDPPNGLFILNAKSESK